MASTTAFYTGLSGLSVHARRLDVIGNNIANVNTTAYKQTRLELQNAMPRTINPGTEPRQATGGTNPYQVGLGVSISGTTRNFTTGSITPTGDPRDLAIEGDGFFIVQRGDDTFYTRNGAFRQDAADDLVTINGEKVMGFGVDGDFNIVEGALTEINIPVGRLQISEPTTLVNYAGNLNAGGAWSQRLLGVWTSGASHLMVDDYACAQRGGNISSANSTSMISSSNRTSRRAARAAKLHRSVLGDQRCAAPRASVRFDRLYNETADKLKTSFGQRARLSRTSSLIASLRVANDSLAFLHLDARDGPAATSRAAPLRKHSGKKTAAGLSGCSWGFRKSPCAKEKTLRNKSSRPKVSILAFAIGEPTWVIA